MEGERGRGSHLMRTPPSRSPAWGKEKASLGPLSSLSIPTHTPLLPVAPSQGCTAPAYDSNQLHAAVVELYCAQEAEIKYSTVQNWYAGDAQGRGGIYNFVTKRGLCDGDKSKISWTQVSGRQQQQQQQPAAAGLGRGGRGGPLVLFLPVLSWPSALRCPRVRGHPPLPLYHTGGDWICDHLEIPLGGAQGRQLDRRVLFGGADQQHAAGRHRDQDGPHRQGEAEEFVPPPWEAGRAWRSGSTTDHAFTARRMLARLLLLQNTRSRIVSKGISAGQSVNCYRGLVQVNPTAEGARNYSQCDSMLIGDQAGANTYPYINVRHPSARVEHEVSPGW